MVKESIVGAVMSIDTVFSDDVAVIPSAFVAINDIKVSPSGSSFIARVQFSFASGVVVASLKLFDTMSVDDAKPENVSDVVAMVIVFVSGDVIIGAETVTEAGVSSDAL